MSSFTVTANAYLRNCYSYDRSLAKTKNREDVSNNKLSYADSSALKKAIRKLGDFEYSDETEEDSVNGLYYNLKSYIDTYNYSLTSGSASSSSAIKKTTSKMKALTEEYSDQLSTLGVTVNEDTGYLTISSSSTANISGTKFEALFGKDSDYMTQMNKYAKKIYSSVDTYI